MPCQLPDEITNVTDDVFSYMCNLAMEKCSRKTEKKKASCGGAAMRKRLLIKNFVAQMLAKDRQSREIALSEANSSDTRLFFDKSEPSSPNITDLESDVMDLEETEVEDEEEAEEDERSDDELDTSSLEVDESHEEEEEQTNRSEGTGCQGPGNAMDFAFKKTESHQLATDSRHQADDEDNVHLDKTFGEWNTPMLDDDFHRVPTPNNHVDEDHLFGDDESTLCRVMPGADEQSSWRFYGLNVNGEHHFPDNFLDDNRDKLYLVDKSDPEDHQLVGLVNMLPSGTLFDDDDNDFPETIHQQQILTDLDDLGKEFGNYTKDRMGRKRPWSLVCAADEEMALTPMAAAAGVSDSGSLLSPLCCGMLQMSPFAVGGDGTNSVGASSPPHQPMLKRVKL